MANRFLQLVLIGSIFTVLIAYLSYVPNSEGVRQINRIRLLSASMKIISFIGKIFELIGIAPEWYVQRESGHILKRFQPAENNTKLKIQDIIIDNIPVRIYSPLNLIEDKKNLLPAIIFYHGGAFYMGSVDTHHPITRHLALQTDFIVVSVEYRLAPEHPFPAGLNDCLEITKYFLKQDNAKKYSIDSKRIAIAGDSAGGNFAAVIGMKLTSKSISENSPRLQILIYPVVQFFDFLLPSYVTPGLQIFHFGRPGQVLEFYMNKSITPDIVLNNHTSIEQKQFYRQYVDWSLIPVRYRNTYKEPISDKFQGNAQLIENAKGILHSDVSPLLVENKILAKLPKTYVLTVDHDRLRDEDFIYVARLKENGVNVVHQHYENTFHGSLTFLDGIFQLEIAHEMLNDIVKYLKDNL